eukprot:2588462-Amphidinium_carterae.1
MACWAPSVSNLFCAEKKSEKSEKSEKKASGSVEQILRYRHHDAQLAEAPLAQGPTMCEQFRAVGPAEQQQLRCRLLNQ